MPVCSHSVTTTIELHARIRDNRPQENYLSNHRLWANPKFSSSMIAKVFWALYYLLSTGQNLPRLLS